MTICQLLADKSFGTSFKHKIVLLKLKSKLRHICERVEPHRLEEAIKDHIKNHTNEFSHFIKDGVTQDQIVDHFYTKIMNHE